MCKDEAVDLVTELEIIFVTQGRLKELRKRAETKRAIEHIFSVILKVCGYISEKTSHGYLGKLVLDALCIWVLTNRPGQLFGKEYGETLTAFKTEFARARTSFDRSIQLEIFQAVAGIGKQLFEAM